MWVASFISASFFLNLLLSVSHSASEETSTVIKSGNLTLTSENPRNRVNATLSDAQNDAGDPRDQSNDTAHQVYVDASSNWRKGVDNFESGEKVITRCRLRLVNYWNYTQGRANVVPGYEFGTVVGVSHSSYSHPYGVFSGSVNPYRHNLRLFSLLNPFFSHLRGNYVFVKNKSSARLIDSPCNLVFIFAQWCPFSMRAAPYINALARAFPQLPVIAIDVDEYLQFRWSLRVFYVPKIKIFVGDHVYKEFNGTETDLDELADFVWQNLRQIPQGPLELRREDFFGPIPTQLVSRPSDYRLQVVWVIFLVSSAYFFGYFVDCRGIRRHITAALKLMSHLLDHRRRRRRNVAAHAALPPPSLPAIRYHSHTE
ncbi:thioredoxin domain containing protein 15 [Echinococcus multilocularis]|uniref:Thioredoxin domain containing protein 15 n=1 Tax=Echinococcus multilocularis TaxID=6211 RepID=A0A068Y5N4_ECHMU|nr:thioredoxin domain containing protein 15 [Echinococcus multilocularis]